jgi:succinyl-CoA synthetase alpha subunit
MFYDTGEKFLKEEKRYLESLGRNLRVTTAVKTSSDTAGAIIDRGRGTADSKIKAFEMANTPVAETPREVAELIS